MTPRALNDGHGADRTLCYTHDTPMGREAAAAWPCPGLLCQMTLRLRLYTRLSMISGVHGPKLGSSQPPQGAALGQMLRLHEHPSTRAWPTAVGLDVECLFSVNIAPLLSCFLADAQTLLRRIPPHPFGRTGCFLNE